MGRVKGLVKRGTTNLMDLVDLKRKREWNKVVEIGGERGLVKGLELRFFHLLLPNRRSGSPCRGLVCEVVE